MEISSNHRYRFSAPRPALWEALVRVDTYRSWWPRLRRFDGRALAEREVWRCAIKPPLPYTISVEVELATVLAPVLIVARLTGDIVGDARLELHDCGPDGDPSPTGGPGRWPGGEPGRWATGDPDRAAGPGVARSTPDVSVSGDANRLATGPAGGPTTEVRLTSRLVAASLPARIVSRLCPVVARWGHDWVFATAAAQFAAATGWRHRVP